MSFDLPCDSHPQPLYKKKKKISIICPLSGSQNDSCTRSSLAFLGVTLRVELSHRLNTSAPDLTKLLRMVFASKPPADCHNHYPELG